MFLLMHLIQKNINILKEGIALIYVPFSLKKRKCLCMGQRKAERADRSFNHFQV